MTRLIDADETIKSLMDMTFYDDEGYIIDDYEDRLAIVKSFVDSVPTVEAQPFRHGKWIRDEFGTRCGVCGLYAYLDKFDQPWESPYCPNCGAKMDAKQEKQNG